MLMYKEDVLKETRNLAFSAVIVKDVKVVREKQPVWHSFFISYVVQTHHFEALLTRESATVSVETLSVSLSQI